MRWSTTDFDTYVEVMPIGDIREHYAGDECWCHPDTEYLDRPMITHNATDPAGEHKTSQQASPEGGR